MRDPASWTICSWRCRTTRGNSGDSAVGMVVVVVAVLVGSLVMVVVVAAAVY